MTRGSGEDGSVLFKVIAQWKERDRLTKGIGTSDLREMLERGEPAIVLFSGEWCPDCRGFKPAWDSWTAGKPVNLYVMDVPRGGDEWKDWSLDEIPTVCAFADGKEINRVHGTIEASDLDGLLRSLSAKP